MSLATIVSWIVCGLIVGLCARFLVPGRQELSLPVTSVLGIVGALIGGFMYSIIVGSPVQPFSLTSHAWYGWIVAILGATLLLWISPYGHSTERSR